MQIDPKLIDYAETDKQRQYIDAAIEHGSLRKAAKALGLDESVVRKSVKAVSNRAARQGWSPSHDMTKTVPDGYHLKGTSTLYDKEGNAKLQWVKSNVDHERQQEMMREAFEAMAEDLPKIEPTKAPEYVSQELMAVYPLGDPHIGLLCWGEEVGGDWDLKIAEQVFCRGFDRLVKTAPKCKESVIVNLGDFFHVDNMESKTSRSGHHQDIDGRYAKMIRVGVKIMRQMITSALEHHETVRVINAIGNHDDTGAMWLSVTLDEMYRNEPRVTIDVSPAAFHYFQFGASMFGVHHGHLCKMDRLPGVMAADQPQMWGNTVYRYWLTGHIHHDSKKEAGGCTMESFRTLAHKETFATGGGYRSLQDSKCLVIHKNYGEIERHTVSVNMIQEDAA